MRARGFAPFWLVIAAATCTDEPIPGAALGEGCLLDSHCDGELVCVFRRCHQACAASEDCPSGQRCVLGEQGHHVCQLPDEQSCDNHIDCPEGQLCAVDQVCRDACAGDHDCLPGQVCASQTCADPDELDDGALPQQGPDEGKPCLYNSECTAPLRCIEGFCLYECEADVDCASGKCLDNACASDDCVPNQQIACACPDMGLGIQICGDAGAYGECLGCMCMPWSPSYAGGCKAETIGGLAIDGASGDRLIAGGFDGSAAFFGGPTIASAGLRDVFVARISDAGADVFSMGFGSAVDDEATDLALDDAGDLILVGTHADTISFGGPALAGSGLFLAKLDGATAAHVWSATVAGDLRDARAVAGDTAVVVAGTFAGTVDFGGTPLSSAGDRDLFIAAFDGDGEHVWSKRFGDAGPQPPPSIALDSAGNVLVTGGFPGTIDFGGVPLSAGATPDAYLAKLDAAGAHVFSASFGGAGGPTSGAAVAVDPDDVILLAGFFNGDVDLGGGPLASDEERAFVARLAPDGAHLSSWSFTDGTRPTAIAPSDDGGVLVAGNYELEGDLGKCMLPPLDGVPPGHRNSFIAKFTASGLAVHGEGFGDLMQTSFVPKIALDAAASTFSITVEMTEGLDGIVLFPPLMAMGSGYVATYPQ